MFGKRSETYTNLHLYKALRLTNYVRDSLHFCATRRFRGSIVRDRFMLWSQIIYGHRTASISPKIVRFYGARPAAGRIVRFVYHFLDIVRCPVKFRYYLKFHGARTAFGRVIEGKITSAGHRTVPGRRPAGVFTHRTGTGRFLFIIYMIPTAPVRAPYGARPGIVRCLTSARKLKKSLNKSADARPGTGRCFMSQTATGEKRRVFAKEHIAFT